MLHAITVVSLGPGAPELMTLGTERCLRGPGKLILRTERHGCVAYLQQIGRAYDTLDPLYDQYEDFDALNQAIAEHLWKAAANDPVIYAVMDASCDASVACLMQQAPAGGQVTVLPGVCQAQACLAALPAQLQDPREGLRTLPALAVSHAQYDPHTPLLITEVDNAALAGDVKLWLMELYREDMEIAFFPPSEKHPRKAVLLPLYELDRQKRFDHTCCVYVPAAPVKSRDRFLFSDLEEIMAILCGPEGCPWDREQTHQSLRPYLVEEAYETLDAIESGNDERIADELGDVLLQVVFHGRIGQDHGTFTDLDITTAICKKMLYRHPHIFGDAACHSADDVAANWEQLKKREKHLETVTDAMKDVSPSLPALMRAAKVQHKAKQVGFDWDTPQDALQKVHEEADEVRQELDTQGKPGEELGDLLFSCVNVARLCGEQPELLLKSATEKFIHRFEAMENLLKQDGKSLEGLTLCEMDVYWEKVKASSGRTCS